MMAGQSQQNEQSTAVVVAQPPRMQMPAEVTDLYHLDAHKWRALVDAVFPLAKTVGAVLQALAWCDRRNLDVFQRVVHIVPMRVGNREVETVWPGIAYYRVTAQRQASFDGWEDVEFGPDKTEAFTGKKAIWENGQRNGYEKVEATVTYPEWARMVVYKILNGRRVALPGPKVWFKETFAAISPYCDVPNAKWARSPRQMIEKCAEAASLRRAFPDVFGDEYSADEMEGKELTGTREAHDVGPGGAAASEEAKPATPTRSDFVDEEGLAADDQHLHGDLGGKPEGDDADFEPIRDGTEHEGPTLAEQAAAHKPTREVWDKPEGFDDWDEFESTMTTRIKIAANLPKLDTVIDLAADNIKHAPGAVRVRLHDLYDEKRHDHLEASK